MASSSSDSPSPQPEMLPPPPGLKPGYVFDPDESMLITLLDKRMRDPTFHHSEIKEMDVYSKVPWELPGGEGGAVIYFFTPRTRSREGGNRANRKVGEHGKHGEWYGRKSEDVKDETTKEIIGLDYRLVFKREGAKRRRGSKTTKWEMHEYTPPQPPGNEFHDLAICKIQEKGKNATTLKKGRPYKGHQFTDANMTRLPVLGEGIIFKPTNQELILDYLQPMRLSSWGIPPPEVKVTNVYLQDPMNPVQRFMSSGDGGRKEYYYSRSHSSSMESNIVVDLCDPDIISHKAETIGHCYHFRIRMNGEMTNWSLNEYLLAGDKDYAIWVIRQTP